MSRAGSDPAKTARTPPYTSYRTFKTFIEDLRDEGVPSRIDRSVLTRFSGVVGAQLTHALRFLGLIDDDGRPTGRLRELVKAQEAGRWPEALRDLLRQDYAPIFAIDLEVRNALPFQPSVPPRVSGRRRGGAEMRDLLPLRRNRRWRDHQRPGDEGSEAAVAHAPPETTRRAVAGTRRPRRARRDGMGRASRTESRRNFFSCTSSRRTWTTSSRPPSGPC